MKNSNFNRISIDKVKDGPGLYIFWFNNWCIYVGKSQNLKIRLNQHYNHSHNEKLKLWIDVYGSQLEFCCLELKEEPGRKILCLEKKFINILQPITNIRRG